MVLAATALSGCDASLPPKPWWPGTRQPKAAMCAAGCWLLAHAILSPNAHNPQLWLVDLSVPNEITLFFDLKRQLPETDPYSRQMMLSQGTFLELLHMARQRGLRAEIELFPEETYGPTTLDVRPTLRVRLAPDATVQPDSLFAQIFRRRTHRGTYEARAPEAGTLQAVTDSVAPHALRVDFAGPDQADCLQQHRAIAMQAWRIEMTTPRTLLESYKVLRIGPAEINEHRDGISVNDPLLRLITGIGLFDRTQASAPDSSAVTGQIDEFNANLATTPAFLSLITQGNDRITQINAGRVYVRAQLAATAQGLSMQPLSQALQEYPEQAEPYAAIHALLDAPQPQQTVQMWTRLGYAPVIGPSPRRGVDAHTLPARG